MSAPLLLLRGLRKRYDGPGWGRGRITAVDGVDLDVQPDEVVGLIGESGCGKSSLARTALGLLPRDGGEVRVLGQDPARLRGAAALALRRRAQLLVQDPAAALNPGLSVRALLVESARIHRPGSMGRGASPRNAPRPDAAEEALHRFGLHPRADALPHALSGGEKRRVTLAMLWLADPVLTIADEPTAGLDAARKADVLDLLLARRAPGAGFLLISHDLPLVLYACTRVVVMDAGRIVDGFTPAEVHAAGRHAVTRRLLWAAGMAPEPE